MANIVYRQMTAPRKLPQQIPPHWAKARLQKPQGGGKFLVQIPGGTRGTVMAKIDTCITTNMSVRSFPYQETAVWNKIKAKEKTDTSLRLLKHWPDKDTSLNFKLLKLVYFSFTFSFFFYISIY